MPHRRPRDDDEDILHRLDRHISMLRQELNEKVDYIMSVLDDLKAQVARTTQVGTSAITAIAGIAAQLQALIDAGNSDPALQALTDELTSDNDALAKAITDNTPAAK